MDKAEDGLEDKGKDKHKKEDVDREKRDQEEDY